MSDYQLNLVSKGISTFSGLVTSIVLARYLGLVLRGDLAFLTQASSMAAIILGMGFAQAFPFFFRGHVADGIFLVFLRIFLCQFAVYGVAALIAAVLIRDTFVSCLLLLTVVATLYQQLESSMAAYKIRLKIWVNIILSLVRILAYLAMFAWLPDSLVWPVLITSALWLGAVLCYVSAAWRSGKRSEGPRFRRVVSYSWVLMVSTLLVVMNYNVDTLMLKWLGTPEDLGTYAVGAGIIVYLWVIPDGIKEVLVSRVVRTSDPRAVIVPLKAALLCGGVSAVALYVAAPTLVPLVFGEEFTSSAGISAILSLGVLSMIYYKILGVIVLAEGRRGFYFATLVVAVALNVILNFVFIPRFGATGAAWVCVSSYALTGASFVVYFCMTKGLRFRDVAWIGKRDVQMIMRLARFR